MAWLRKGFHTKFFKHFAKKFSRFREITFITMTEESNRETKKCSSKGKAMFAYGIIQLSSSVISALALAAIALSFCSLKQESKVFNECFEEVKKTGKSSSTAVHFCNGGK